MAKKPSGKFIIKWVKDTGDQINMDKIDSMVARLPKELADEAYNELMDLAHLDKAPISIELSDFGKTFRKGKPIADGTLGKGITEKDLEGTDIKKSTMPPKKKGPSDIKPKTLDETAKAFEDIELPKNVGPESGNVGTGESKGYAKPKSYMSEKKVPPISIPEGKTRVSNAGKKLSQFGEKLSEKAKGKTADFKRLYGGALDDVLSEIEGGKFPSNAEIPYNPEYTSDLMTRAQKELGKVGKAAKGAINQQQNYVDLLGERLKDAAPNIVRPNKAPPTDLSGLEFNGEIPPRMEPPPIPKEAIRENLYDPKVWKEFSKEQPVEPEVNWREYRPQGGLLEGPEAPKLIGQYKPPPVGPEIPEIPKKTYEYPRFKGLDEIERGFAKGKEILTSPYHGYKMMLEDLVKKGEKPVSIMKEAAADAAKFMKNNKLTRQELLDAGIKVAPWIGWGLVAYEILHHGPAAGMKLAAENELPWWEGAVMGELGSSTKEHATKSSIYDYVPTDMGMQG